MYVKRLIEFAEAHPKELVPIGFKEKKMQWVADIEDGFIRLTPAGKKQETVPDIARSSGTKPILIVDKADYVFGVSDTVGDEKRSKERHQAYIELLELYLESNDDSDVRMLHECLGNRENIDELLKEKGMKMNDHIYFRVRGDELLHEKTAVDSFWGKHVQPVSTKADDDLICMYCGEKGPVMERHTINFLIGPDRTKLISANENAYESHGLKNSHIAPTCYQCEQKYGKALEYLLTSYKGKEPGGPHMFKIGDVTFVHWISNDSQLQSGLGLVIQPPKEQGVQDMKVLLNKIFKGKEADRSMKNFCMLTLSANKARLVVRDYAEDSAAFLKERIQCFFNAQDVGADRYYGIYTLAATMYADANKQMQKHALKEWMDWFLQGKKLSDRILRPILHQIQVDGAMYANHAAAIQSWLMSQNERVGSEGRMVDMTGDLKGKSSAYKIGRLFAVLEKIQKEAINSKNTISTKYFSAASTTPKSVMGQLIRNAQHHLSKIADGEQGTGLAIYYDKRLTTIYGEIQEYPDMLNAEGQAEFAMGYYHEKLALYAPKNKEGDA